MLRVIGVWFCVYYSFVCFSQINVRCNTEWLNDLHCTSNPIVNKEGQLLNNFVQSFISKNEVRLAPPSEFSIITEYTIPTVIHVFHFGEIGKIGLEQAQSGLDIINEDFQGLNDDWNTVDPIFEDIKSTLNIKFILATIDPNGNNTTGVIYHEDSLATYNKIALDSFAWDNRKYLNIYLPKYIRGDSAIQSGYTRYPSILNINGNRGGIFVSSTRWGYGGQSDFQEGDEWASVTTHEAGHWLGLYHTFRGGCEGDGDEIEDTPPSTDNGIQIEGCENNNLSCNVVSNGENYMDYNHGCKKMFTKGQVARMVAVLHSDPRKNLWSSKNLKATGYNILSREKILAYPNPANDWVTFDYRHAPVNLRILNYSGLIVNEIQVDSPVQRVDVSDLKEGLYFCSYTLDGKAYNGKFIIARDQ